MHLANKFIKNTVILGLAAFFLSFVSKKMPLRLQQKVEAAITTTYGLQSFVLEPVVETGSKKVIPAKDHILKIIDNGEHKGFAYVGEAKSMKNVFDYVLLFDPDLSVKKAKVLIYREEHGRQIGAQRWLKQFIGLTVDETPDYGETIDAISGATISAKSMTITVGKVFKRIKELKLMKLL